MSAADPAAQTADDPATGWCLVATKLLRIDNTLIGTGLIGVGLLRR